MRPLPECSDEELLSRVIAASDYAAFAALAERYEVMVLRVCMRVLHHQQDVEDACQDALLVLWQKARLIRNRQKLRCWLHGVARREALRIRRDRKRRERHENSCGTSGFAHPIDKVYFKDLISILNASIQRVPKKYRRPLLLCCLEGKSKAEAAAELGLPVGTISCQLARGRKLLQRQLGEFGILSPSEFSKGREP